MTLIGIIDFPIRPSKIVLDIGTKLHLLLSCKILLGHQSLNVFSYGLSLNIRYLVLIFSWRIATNYQLRFIGLFCGNGLSIVIKYREHTLRFH